MRSPPNLSGKHRARRAGRSLLYGANLTLIPFITRFLTNDCCDGRPEACGFAPATTRQGEFA